MAIARRVVGELLTEIENLKPTEEWARLLEDYEVFFPGSGPLRDALRRNYRDAVSQLVQLGRVLRNKLEVISAAGSRTRFEYARSIAPTFRL